MMNRINWLHISDIHIGGEDFDRDTVVTAILEDVQSRTSRVDPGLDRIDLVFLTGDLVFSGHEREYDLAYQYLIEPLAQELGITDLSQHVFLVPGNHDVDRSRSGVTRQAVRDMVNRQDGHEKVKDLLLNDNEMEAILTPQTAYYEFFSDTFGSIDLLSPCKYYVHRAVVNDRNTIAIVGLNSAWLAYGGDDDRGKLILGEPQIVKALDRCSNDDFVICLLHHPFDWFNPNIPDTAQCKSRLVERSRMILHGHIHIPNLIGVCFIWVCFI